MLQCMFRRRPTQPTRANLCSWLSVRLGEIRTRPLPPDDTQRDAVAEDAYLRIQRLRVIAAELGAGYDDALDTARALVAAYDADYPA